MVGVENKPMATIPIHQTADCGVTKPLRREPHAACRPIDTTLYHAIDDGSLSLLPSLTRTSQSTERKRERKRVNRTGFSRFKRFLYPLLFFSFLIIQAGWRILHGIFLFFSLIDDLSGCFFIIIIYFFREQLANWPFFSVPCCSLPRAR